jgi:F-type H+-transporting ATPase subunit beta
VNKDGGDPKGQPRRLFPLGGPCERFSCGSVEKKFKDPRAGLVGQGHWEVATRARQALSELKSAAPEHALSEGERTSRSRARKLSLFLSQPFFVAEPYTRKAGRRVTREQAVSGCGSILDGRLDGWHEEAFRFIGEV